MTRHDSLWKGLLHHFFDDFLELVVPEIRQHLDVEKASFLDQEALTDLPGGHRVHFDVVARAPTRSGSNEIVLIHVEVERVFRKRMDARMFRYFMHLKLKFGLPVVPIVLFLRGGPAGIERRAVVDRVVDLEINRFSYWAFGLSGIYAEDHLDRSTLSPALAACMRSRWPLHELKYRCLAAVAGSLVDEARRFLLVNAVETYLDLAGEEAVHYAEHVARNPLGQEIKSMEMTWADRIEAKGLQKGLQTGMERGRTEGLRGAVEVLLIERFDLSKAQARRCLKAIDEPDRLTEMARLLVRGASLAELGLDG
jgi:hypothetical protein